MARTAKRITTEEFDIALESLVAEATPQELLSTPGVYEALSEAWNNDIIRRAQEVK